MYPVCGELFGSGDDSHREIPQSMTCLEVIREHSLLYSRQKKERKKERKKGVGNNSKLTTF